MTNLLSMIDQVSTWAERNSKPEVPSNEKRKRPKVNGMMDGERKTKDASERRKTANGGPSLANMLKQPANNLANPVQ